MSTLSVSATLLSVHIHTAAAYPQYITCTQLLYNCSFHMNFTMLSIYCCCLLLFKNSTYNHAPNV